MTRTAILGLRLILYSPLAFCSVSVAQTPAEREAATVKMLSSYPPASGAFATRIGNSSGGTTITVEVPNNTKRIPPDGAPARLSVPFNVDRAGIELGPNRTDFTIRLHAKDNWHEGSFHTVFVSPKTLRVLGGVFDYPWPRQDLENKDSVYPFTNAWLFATGFYLDGGWGKGPFPDDYRNAVPVKEIAPGEDSGVPGYSYTSDKAGFSMSTPKGKVYSLIPWETIAPDPTRSTDWYSVYNRFTLNLASKGDGKELKSFAPTFDWKKYPTDPRLLPHLPGILGVREVGGETYMFVFFQDIAVYQWSTKGSLWVPIAIRAVRPDALAREVVGGPRDLDWGEGAIAVTDSTGNFYEGGWRKFNSRVPYPQWIDPLLDLDADANLYQFPGWSGGSDRNSVVRWRTFDPVRGIFAPGNYTLLPLPDSLRTAETCIQMRVDFKSGDLVAVVRRGSDTECLLERYPGWLTAGDKAAVKASYSVGPVALNVRQDFESYAQWNEKWLCSLNGKGDIPRAGIGAMQVIGDYVVIAAVQAGGIRIHDRTTGKRLAICESKDLLNSTIDDRTQIQLKLTNTELLACLMDFHGQSSLMWRVPLASLRANLKGVVK